MKLFKLFNKHPYIKKFIYLDLIGIIAGFLGGLGAIVFRKMIEIIRHIFYIHLLNNVFNFSFSNYNFGVILLPAIGGLIVGPIVFKIAPETKGHGVPEVIESIRLHHGYIRGRVAFVKIFVSSITIGSGGSAGREGPIAQIGASLGSILSRIFKLGVRERRILIVSGLSAGIAGTFNAPLGGALFGLEVLLGGFSIIYAIPIILASVIGAAIVSYVYGPYPAFYTPPHLTFRNPTELIFYFLLGIIFGFLSILWVKAFYFFEDLHDSLPVNPKFKPAIGGLITGFIGVFFLDYGLLGVGYEGIELVLLGELELLTLLLLGTLKIITTANTIGSGGSGGVFAPSLYIGAMYGGALGIIFHTLFPSIVEHPFTYSLAGMASLFAGAAHAPISMIVMIPEMTNDYSLLPPLMASTSTSYIISKMILGDSNIYTLKLKRRGVKIFVGEDLSVFEMIKVRDFMTKDPITVHPETPANKVYELIRDTHHDCFPVVKDGKLIGKISSDEILSIPVHLLAKYKVKDLMSKHFEVIYDDEPLIVAIEKIFHGASGKIFVVDRENRDRVIGIITKTDIVKAYGYIANL